MPRIISRLTQVKIQKRTRVPWPNLLLGTKPSAQEKVRWFGSREVNKVHGARTYGVAVSKTEEYRDWEPQDDRHNHLINEAENPILISILHLALEPLDWNVTGTIAWLESL